MADSTWRHVDLIDLAVDRQISYGVVQPGADDPSGVPIVRVKDLRNGSVDTGNPVRVRAEVSDRHSRTLLRGGELLVSLVGTVGQVAVAPPELAGWNVARAIAVVRPDGVDPEWLRFCFETDSVQHQVAAAVNTTVQTTLNLSDLKRVRVPFPDRSIRRAIAEVLGALDDKIAANTRLATTADALAASHFRRAANGIAVGSTTYADIAEIGGGGTPSTKVAEYWDGAIQWASPTDITALSGPYLMSTSRTITDEGLDACSSRLYPAGSILMTSRATIGVFALAEVPVAVNQGFIVVVPPDDISRYWLFHEMRSRVGEYLNHANGATFLELSRGSFRRLTVRLGDPEDMARFASVARPLHDSAAAALEQSRTLGAVRDALLPALMSGKLRVRDAESIAGELI